MGLSRFRTLLAVGVLTLGVAPPATPRPTDSTLAAAVRDAQARPADPRMARAAFLPREVINEVQLSPDGMRLAWLQSQGELREVWFQDVATGRRQRIASRTSAQTLVWTGSGRWLLLASPAALQAVDRDGRHTRVITALGGTRQREVLRVDSTRDAVIVLDRAGRDAHGQVRQWRLSRVDFQGRETLLFTSVPRVVNLTLDTKGRVAWVQRVATGALTLERLTPGGLHEVTRCSALHKCSLLATAPNGDLWLRGDLGQDLTGLQRLSPSGTVTSVMRDPRGIADVDRVLVDPVTAQPRGVSWRSDVAFNRFLAPDGLQAERKLRGLLPDATLDIEPGHGTARWLVRTSYAWRPGSRWYLYDPRSHALQLAFDSGAVNARNGKPAAHWHGHAHVQPVTWRASDGLRLHGFVTLPPGVDLARAPLVVNVHGGPWNHVRPEYRGITQFLANRGYIVFEPNFRASTGFGRAQVFAAKGDFGNGRVQADIVEGTRWLLAQGVGHATRVGITGASFGGYSTLQGLTHQADLFKAGVAMVPPPDFAWTLRWTARNPEALNLANVIPMQDWLRALDLDLARPGWDATLRAQSPMANVAKLTRPLLMFAGGQDARVGIAGVIEYTARARLAGKDVTLLIDPKAGHSNRDPVAREAYLLALETMFARHLGGPPATAPDGEVRQFMVESMRCAGRDFAQWQRTRRDAS